MMHVSVLLCLVGVSLGNYIKVKQHSASQDYYLSFVLQNIDAAVCGDTISKVQVLQQNVWRDYNQYYYEDGIGDRYAWDYTGVKFSDMFPMSVRIETQSGREVVLWGVYDSFSTDEFTSDQLICDGTLSPTAPTPHPTTKTPTAPTTPYPTAETICVEAAADEIQWTSVKNEIRLNGNRFNMKGLSWFGYETGEKNLYGLDRHDQDWYFTWMKENGFNAMRLPFSADFMDESLANRNRYKATVNLAGKYGIFVMPDMHSKTPGAWMDGLHTIQKSAAINTWVTVANLLKDEYNVFIADVFNEPHDVSNSQWGEWITFCKNVAEAIWATGANWMIAIEGTNWECSNGNCAWGENLQGVKNAGVTFSGSKQNKFVWSPHVYGADVTGNGYSPEGWESHWGYLVNGNTPSNQAASIIGEFGTRYTDNMVQWLDDLVDYLIEIDARNTFFWCLNPNSGDTGGLLKDDWTTAESGKLAALDKLQSNPSATQYNEGSNTICIQFEGNGGLVTPPPVQTPAPTYANLKVRNCEGANENKYSAEILELPSGMSIQSVRMRDGSGQNGWMKGSYDENSDCYVWENGNTPYGLPLDFKVKAGGITLRANNVIDSWEVNSEGDFGQNYALTRDEAIANGLFTYGEEGNDKNGLSMVESMAIGCIGIIVLVCVVIGVVWFKRRKNKGNNIKDGMETNIEIPKDGNSTPPSTEMSGFTQTNIIAVDDD